VVRLVRLIVVVMVPRAGFTTGSECIDLNDECCDSCQLKKSKTLCRPSYDPCTYSQACTGVSGTCPSSITLEDGTSCRLILLPIFDDIATGTCTSRNLQCQKFGYFWFFKLLDLARNKILNVLCCVRHNFWCVSII
jgi:hypothetical protein